MKRLFALLALFLLALPAMAEPAHEVLYFYENYCESCDPEAEFAKDFFELTGIALSRCDFKGYNVARSGGRSAFEEFCREHSLEDAALPLTEVDGKIYVGGNALRTDLPKDALSWGGSTDSTVLYLYVPACESCARAVQALDALPENVQVRRGDMTFESKVTVEKIDVSARSDVAMQLFEQYEVPDEQRITPSVFFGEHYLSGADAIEKNLAQMVELGWAVGGGALTEVEGAEAPARSEALSLAGTLGAGLVAGLNTCALSMLLLFLSLILEARRPAGLLAACYLGAKFACYLLIGFVLTGLLQRYNPHWLQPLAKGLLTAAGAALIALNLWDAVQARRERYGKVRNQLPSRLRGRLHRTIRTLTKSRVLIPACILLGFLVGMGEFLCAGQIYLMRLLSAVQAGERNMALQLIAYCAAFIAPSAVLCALVLGGKNQLRVSEFLAEHMAAVKLLTAAVMLAMIVLAWFI